MPNKVIFALLYLSFIPAFACVYSFLLPNDFYHATVQYESSTMNEAAQDILDGLRTNISQRIVEAKNGKNCDSWRLSPDTLRVHSLKAEGEKVSFAISGMLGNDDGGHSEYYFSNRFSFLLNQRMITIPPGGSATVGFFLTSEEPMPVKLPLGDVNLQTCLFPRGASLSYAPLEIPETLYSRTVSFASAVHGFPGHFTGQFSRMLYLSATTITTLGFGDIVPLTTSARLVVSLESVLGIILIWLFVNAVSAEKKREKRIWRPPDEQTHEP